MNANQDRREERGAAKKSSPSSICIQCIEEQTIRTSSKMHIKRRTPQKSRIRGERKQTNRQTSSQTNKQTVRRNTYPSAILSSVTASCISTAVCSILYSTLSSSVPWSITSADRSLNSSASCAMDRAISVISLSRCCRSTAGASSSSCWSCNVDACRSPCDCPLKFDQ